MSGDTTPPPRRQQFMVEYYTPYSVKKGEERKKSYDKIILWSDHR